ncbi:MAG: hypothetical protein PF484_11210 [Bacteroidales bacterium]|jgi:hypothetical protein|nr:hypothetical protein [Bacteroidales bacterium]
MKNLTDSNIDRQNILNNRFALEKIQEYVGLSGMLFEEEYKFTIQMVAAFMGLMKELLKDILRIITTN